MYNCIRSRKILQTHKIIKILTRICWGAKICNYSLLPSARKGTGVNPIGVDPYTYGT